jgi:diacylglycerol kinase (ATP)
MPNDSEERFVRNEQSKESKSDYALTHAFRCAGEGIAYAVASQRNLKIQCAAAVIVVVLGFAFRIDAASWLAIVLCIGAVIAAECANTAMESAIDLVSPEWNILAKRAKDAAAGAVLVLSFMSVAVGCIVFVPRILALL